LREFKENRRVFHARIDEILHKDRKDIRKPFTSSESQELSAAEITKFEQEREAQTTKPGSIDHIPVMGASVE
jgi:hypothetical protein